MLNDDIFSLALIWIYDEVDQTHTVLLDVHLNESKILIRFFFVFGEAYTFMGGSEEFPCENKVILYTGLLANLMKSECFDLNLMKS